MTALGAVLGAKRCTSAPSSSRCVFLFAATGEWVAERAGTLNISVEGMLLAGRLRRRARARYWAASGGVARCARRLRRRRSSWRSSRPTSATASPPTSSSSASPSTCSCSASPPTSTPVIDLAAGAGAGVADPASSPICRSSARRCSPARGRRYFVYALVPALWWLVYRTRWGLEVRAVGERPAVRRRVGHRRQRPAPPGDPAVRADVRVRRGVPRARPGQPVPAEHRQRPRASSPSPP